MLFSGQSSRINVRPEQESLTGTLEEVTTHPMTQSDVRLVYAGAAVVALLLVGHLLKQRRENVTD